MNEGMSEDDARAYTENTLGQVASMDNLSGEEKVQVVAMIAEAESTEEINRGLKNIAESGNIEDFEVKGKLSEEDFVERAKRQLSSVTEDMLDDDINFDLFPEMAEHIRSTAKESEELADSLETDADEVQNIAEDILKYDSALERAVSSMED